MAEDYQTFIEVDPNSHLALVGTNHLDFDAYNNEDCYLYKDYGADYFGDFVHKVDVKIISADIHAIPYLFALTNDIDDIAGLNAASKSFIGLQIENMHPLGAYRIGLVEGYSGTKYSYTTYLSLDTWYYITITKSGTSLICKVYYDSARTSLKGTLSLTLHANHKFRYLFGCNTYNDGNNLGSTLDIKNLSIGVFKGIYVPLQSTKQLLDVALKPGDAVVYTDPAKILTLGELLSFQGKSFLLVSNSKIQYINGNPIYMELGLERFLPSLNLQGSYDIRTCISFSLSSLYNISQNLFSRSIPSSYDIPTPVSTSFSLSSLYNITQNLFSISAPSSYDILTAPAQVTGLRAEADEGRNILTFWIAIEDEDLDYYKVHRSTLTGFAPSDANLVGIPKTNQFTHKDLDSVTKYYVKVCAVSKQGDSGSYSTQAYATTVE